MVTLKEFAVQFTDWVDHSHSLEKKTRAYYRHGWNLLSATRVSDAKLDGIKNRDLDTLSFPGGAANANTALRTLRRMLAHAQELDLIEQVPKIKLRKEWPRSIAMTREQCDLIIIRMPAGDPRDALSILRATGARPSEVFSMRWEYVLPETQTYRNPTGKTRSARRIIPLLHPAGDVLARRHSYQGRPVSGWIFPASSGSGHMVTIQKAFVKARRLAGLPKELVLYTARHGAATELAAVLSTKELMNVLGHSDAATAMRYQHPETANLQARLDQIPPPKSKLQ
jgi:integrase